MPHLAVANGKIFIAGYEGVPYRVIQRVFHHGKLKEKPRGTSCFRKRKTFFYYLIIRFNFKDN
jgi:hypothetical protein